jgi:hypothetical protein
MTWTRALSTQEATLLQTRYAQLVERWQQRWPDEPPPVLQDDALMQSRVIQAMAHRLRGAGEIRPEGGLRRGPGLLIEDRELREAQERAASGAPPPEETNGGDPSTD